MQQKMIYEILDQVKNATDKNLKINTLRANNTQALREVLKYSFLPHLKFFTNQVPKYKPDNPPEGMSFNSLFNECRRFYILTEEPVEFSLCGKRTNANRKMEILTQILENIHPNEAEVLSRMVTGDFSKYYGITKKLVEEAFPGLLGK